MPRSDVDGSYDNSISSLLRNLLTVLHRGCVDLQSHQQCRGVPFSPHPLPLFSLVPIGRVASRSRTRSGCDQSLSNHSSPFERVRALTAKTSPPHPLSYLLSFQRKRVGQRTRHKFPRINCLYRCQGASC